MYPWLAYMIKRVYRVRDVIFLFCFILFCNKPFGCAEASRPPRSRIISINASASRHLLMETACRSITAVSLATSYEPMT